MEQYEKITKKMRTWGWSITTYQTAPTCSYCGKPSTAKLRIGLGLLGARHLCNNCKVKIINQFERL